MNKCPDCLSEMIDTTTDYEINNVKFIDVKVKKCTNCGKILIENDTMNELLMRAMKEGQKSDYQRKNEIIANQLNDMELVCKLKVKRLAMNITQKDLAERTNSLPQRISAIEREGKNISLEKAFKIAYALGCDINEVFCLESKNSKRSSEKEEITIKERAHRKKNRK